MKKAAARQKPPALSHWMWVFLGISLLSLMGLLLVQGKILRLEDAVLYQHPERYESYTDKAALTAAIEESNRAQAALYGRRGCYWWRTNLAGSAGVSAFVFVCFGVEQLRRKLYGEKP